MNVWTDIPEPCKNSFHFTPKPMQAISRIILLHTFPGDMVLDCFAGSGTTGVVCQQMKRDFILIEKNPVYCEKISARIKVD